MDKLAGQEHQYHHKSTMGSMSHSVEETMRDSEEWTLVLNVKSRLLSQMNCLPRKA